MPAYRNLTLGFILLGGLLTGCSWTDMEEWSSQGIWSDDGEAAIGVYQYFEGKNTRTHLKKRNMETVIYHFADVNGAAEPQIILPRGRGWATQIYFMRSQGYLIVHRQERLPDLDDGANRTENYTAYKITLAGQVSRLGETRALSMISCDAAGQSAVSTGDVLTVIPSPDGLILAKVETQVTCQGRTGQLTFLDAEDLTILDGPFDLPRVGVDTIPGRAWSTDGRFMVGSTGFGGVAGQSYAPSTMPQPLPDLDFSCFFPETTSSDTNDQGQSLSNDDGRLTVIQAMNMSPTFGCDP